MRRKLGVACYYGPNHQMKTKTEQCPCQREDFECAPCFFRPDLGKDCERECGETPLPTKEQCPTAQGSYQVDNGMKLIEENKCSPRLPGATVPKATVSCSYRNPGPVTPLPPPMGHKFQTKEVFMMSFAILAFTGAVGGILFFLLYYRHEGFRTAVQRRCGLAPAADIGQSLADTSDSDLIADGVLSSSDSESSDLSP